MLASMATEPLVYLNGVRLPQSQAGLPIHDAAIVLGATVTEQTRTFRQQPFRIDEHLERLCHSLSLARIDPGMSRTEMKFIALELVEHNAALLSPEQELGLIQFVTAGEVPTYAGSQPVRNTPTVCIHTFPLRFERWAKPMREGARLVTPAIRHVPPECYPPAMKYRSRMHFYLADREVRDRDPEAYAVLLDLAGNITETSAANFLMLKDGVLVSPTLRNILPGISRAITRSLAEREGLGFVERDVSVAEALQAEEIFLASTPYCLMAVSHLNGQAIGEGKPGRVFSRLMAAWSREVGLDVAAQILASTPR